MKISKEKMEWGLVVFLLIGVISGMGVCYVLAINSGNYSSYGEGFYPAQDGAALGSALFGTVSLYLMVKILREKWA